SVYKNHSINKIHNKHMQIVHVLQSEQNYYILITDIFLPFVYHLFIIYLQDIFEIVVITLFHYLAMKNYIMFEAFLKCNYTTTIFVLCIISSLLYQYKIYKYMKKVIV